MSILGQSLTLFAETEEKVDALAWSPDLALFTLILFVVFVAILSLFAWKPIMSALEEREKSVSEKIDAAEANAARMEGLKNEYEAKLAAAAEEASRMVAEAKVKFEPFTRAARLTGISALKRFFKDLNERTDHVFH